MSFTVIRVALNQLFKYLKGARRGADAQEMRANAFLDQGIIRGIPPQVDQLEAGSITVAFRTDAPLAMNRGG